MISTSGHLIPKFPEVRFHRTRIFNKQFVQIHMKGTINYLWEGLNISKDCTFLDTFKASGSSLVESSYLDWPD